MSEGRGRGIAGALVLLLATFAVLAGRSGIVADGDAGPVKGLGLPPGRPSVVTDKACYFPGENVTVVLRNEGPGPLLYDWMPDFEIVSVALGAVRMVLDGFRAADVVLSPGREMSFLWDQHWHARTPDGELINPFKLVPEGEYDARVLVPLGQDPTSASSLGEAPFVIGACDVTVGAGPDLTVDEGQAFQLRADIELGDANLTSVAWDLDATVDTNGDGNPRNDADLIGASPTASFGDDGAYTATLTVRGFFPKATGAAAKQDAVLAIDSSGSMATNDPLGLRRTAARAYVDLLTPDDRAAVVDFDTVARLVNGNHLTTNYTRVKADIDTIDSFGGTFLTTGLETALDELQSHGAPFHEWVVIFLTDAESIIEDDEILMPIQVNRAKALGAAVYTVGLHVPVQLEPLMREIADATGGVYYPAPTADALRDIYDAIGRRTRQLRGSFFLASDAVTITVRNVAPSAAADAGLVPTATANLTIRVAGERWHDVRLELTRDGGAAGTVSVVRYPGSPDEQAATLAGIALFAGEAAIAHVVYTPDDDPVNGQPNGADPAWILAALSNGTEFRFHHTFNARQPETWAWDVDLTPLAAGGSAQATVATTITDPGTDDVFVSVDWGDGTTEHRTYYNDGLGPDPRRSPGGLPVTLGDVAVHRYATRGIYEVTITVADDDGGVTVLVIVLDIR